MSQLPLIFFTAILAFALIGGWSRGARLGRLVSLLVAFACLALWALGLLTYAQGDGALVPAIDGFYATAYLRERLGPLWAGLLVSLLALGPLVFAAFELRGHRPWGRAH